MELRKLPIGIQSFEDLRKNDYLYVDKTEYIWKLVQTGKTYFLSRPRRFGKSLLVSTIEAYFKGQKSLFHDLYIVKKEKKWECYPVLRFSLASGSFETKDGLKNALELVLLINEKRYDIDRVDLDLPNRFKYLIEQIYEKTGKQSVVLVDEYDKPLLDAIEHPDIEEENRNLYQSFFSALKDEDQYIKFVFITGVTKFSKVSVFSGLNQPEDISLSEDYSCICGLTENEIMNQFLPEIKSMAAENELSEQECIKELAKMYDGYHFSRKGEGVYNPYSLFNALKQKNFGRYWFETATPTFLIKELQKSDYTIEMISEGLEAEEEDLSNARTENPKPIALFYQAGYLTISGYDANLDLYVLRFPNEEVRYGFLKALAPYILGQKDSENSVSVRKMAYDLQKGNLEDFMIRVKSLFAGIPYIEGDRRMYEQEWRNEMYVIFAMLGEKVQCEVHTASGRADCIAETNDYIYIFEFKVDKNCDEALKQIKDKKYAERYASDHRKIYKVGINFSSSARNIESWKAA